jgi:hypothetical protein
MVLYILGEASGWGKWVGSLCHPENFKGHFELNKAIAEDRGKKFPHLWYIGNIIVKEDNDKIFIKRLAQYLWHCRVTLVLRGLYWWMPLYLFLAFAGLISYSEALIIGLLLGIGFPVACELGRRWNFTYEYKFFHTSRGWCNQELFYGLFQGIALWYVVISHV